MTHPLREISLHTFVYRGLVIRKSKHSKLNPITRYRVSDPEYSYGLFDTLADAMRYIDRLVRNYYEEKRRY